ncbi:MsnO8 family LLM class oxidoreductase [Enterobacter cloacae]
MTKEISIPFSILDIARIPDGLEARDAYHYSLEQAQYAESLGYHRYWVAEHHCIKTQASSSPALLIGYLASNTNKIRLGAGGVMLPNHSTLSVAEQFGMLESFYPGRIDLGVGRAPGGNRNVMQALRRNSEYDMSQFPRDINELISWFDAKYTQESDVTPVPGYGMRIPVWVLGSSLNGAELAAKLGLPFAFSAHSSPDDFKEAISVYRNKFKSSERLESPYVMITLNIVTSDKMSTAISLFENYVHLYFKYSGLPIPEKSHSLRTDWTPSEKFGIPRVLRNSIIGDKTKVFKELRALLEDTKIDEIMINSAVTAWSAQLNSLKLTMDAIKGSDKIKIL